VLLGAARRAGAVRPQHGDALAHHDHGVERAAREQRRHQDEVEHRQENGHHGGSPAAGPGPGRAPHAIDPGVFEDARRRRPCLLEVHEFHGDAGHGVHLDQG
jgi:hypothetical protein